MTNEVELPEEQAEENPKIKTAKKCFSCSKEFDQSFWSLLKTKIKRKSPIECINCEEIFCSDCYKNEIRYSPKDRNKKGYSCNKCLEETRVDSDVLFLPVNTLKDSIEEVKVQLKDFKTSAEPVLNEKIIPLLNETKDLVLNAQKTFDEAKPTLLELLKKSVDKDLKGELSSLNKKFSWILFLLTILIALLVVGEVMIMVKFVFN